MQIKGEQPIQNFTIFEVLMSLCSECLRDSEYKKVTGGQKGVKSFCFLFYKKIKSSFSYRRRSHKSDRVVLAFREGFKNLCVRCRSLPKRVVDCSECQE